MVSVPYVINIIQPCAANTPSSGLLHTYSDAFAGLESAFAGLNTSLNLGRHMISQAPDA